MEQTTTTTTTSTGEPLVNQYEPRAVSRTYLGVASSMLFMGLPIGLAEAIRPYGNTTVALIGGLCTILAILAAWLSIRGTLKA